MQGKDEEITRLCSQAASVIPEAAVVVVTRILGSSSNSQGMVGNAAAVEVKGHTGTAMDEVARLQAALKAISQVQLLSVRVSTVAVAVALLVVLPVVDWLEM